MTQTMLNRCVMAGLLLAGCHGSPGSDPCYAPGKNLDGAYEEDAVGCACEPETPGVCSEGVGLICEGGSWIAVIDGPCFPGPGERCGEGFCSQFGYCKQNDDGSEQCVSKLATGAACSGSNECASGTCTDQVCR